MCCAKLHVSVVCGLFYSSIPTEVTARHILKVAASSVQAFLLISKNIFWQVTEHNVYFNTSLIFLQRL
jgi:hypothetical protein